MKIGILQGRLLEPVNDKIQEFPLSNWKEEFEKLEALKLNHLEWIVTSESYNNNPLFSENLQNLPISSVCCDNLIHNNIHKLRFLEEQLDPICHAALKNKIQNISIPLLEDSNLENDNRRREFINSINIIKDKFPTMKFIFEPELHPEKVLEILNTNFDFLLTYDTGNITSYLKKHVSYIELLSNKIVNVHLKDRTFSGTSVEPFTGDTDFAQIFQILKKNKYNSIFTLQLARGLTGQEEQYINYYKQKFEDLYE